MGMWKYILTSHLQPKMKFLLFTLCAILVFNTARADDVTTTKTCEDFLPATTCARLRQIAKEFNEKVGIVNQAITDAYNHHKTRAAEVLSYVKEYLVARATNFKCESVLSAENCQKLQDIAKKLHLTATQASLAIKEAIVNGAQKVSDISQKALAYMRDKLSTLTCENVLEADQCKKLKDVAALIHVKAGEVNKAIREAIIEGAAKVQDQFQKAMDFLENEVTCEKVFGQERCDQLRDAAQKFHENAGVIKEAIKAAINKHLTKVQDVLTSVRDTLVEKAKNFKCTDVLTQDQCNKIDDIGARLKLKSDEIKLALKEAIANGAEQAKQIYNRALGFFLNDVKNLKCEDLASADTCNKIREYAKKIGDKTADAATAIKEAIIQGAATAKDQYQKAVEFLKAQFDCENVLSKDTCDKIRGLADKFHISMQKVDAALREAVANGVKSVTDLYKAAVKYIMDKWSGIFGNDISKRSIGDGIKDFWHSKVKVIVEQILDTLKVKSEELRQKIMSAVEKGKLKLKGLKTKISEIVASLKNQDSLDDMSNVYKRSVTETLTEALKTAHGKAKELIEKLLKLSKDKMNELKEWLKQLKGTGLDIASDEMADDLDLLHDVLDAGTKAHFENLVEDAIENIQ